MQRMQVYKLILCIAAMIFIAKPFMGYGLYEQLQNNSQENSMIVKIFAKRKPEFLEEAITSAVAFQALIKEKSQQFMLTISALLLSVFPIFICLSSFRRRNVSLGPPLLNSIDPIYLLTCRLTI